MKNVGRVADAGAAECFPFSLMAGSYCSVLGHNDVDPPFVGEKVQGKLHGCFQCR